eukprot:145667_1
MGCCFGRKRDQNDDLLENGFDLESQEVVKHPTQSSPKHGALSSLVPSKQIVMAVIGALLLLGVSIGGYNAWRKKKIREAQRRFFGVPSDAIQEGVHHAQNFINGVHSDLHADIQQAFGSKPSQGGARHRDRGTMGTGLHNGNGSEQVTMGTGPQRSPVPKPRRRRIRHHDHRGAQQVQPTSPMGTGSQSSFATTQQRQTGPSRHHRFMSSVGRDTLNAGLNAADSGFGALNAGLNAVGANVDAFTSTFDPLDDQYTGF